jgi:predicted XRE-type DNA-binding protein
MVKYLGHLRNAADHGVDSEIGTQWQVSAKTAVEYVHVAQSTISAMVKRELGILQI